MHSTMVLTALEQQGLCEGMGMERLGVTSAPRVRGLLNQAGILS